MARYNDKTTLSQDQIRDFARALESSIGLLLHTVEAMEKYELESIGCRNYVSGKNGAEAVLKFASAAAEAVGFDLVARNKALNQTAKEIDSMKAVLAESRKNSKKKKP